MVKGKSDRWFGGIVNALLILMALLCLLPMLYVVSVSLTPYTEIIRTGGFILVPRLVTLDAYKRLYTYPGMFQSMGVSIAVTALGTVISLILSLLIAYPLSKKGLPGRKAFNIMVLITLLFGGGTIPTYLIVKGLGMVDTIWAMILPSAIWSSNVFIMRTYFITLPEELFDAARIDGAGEFFILRRIALPLSVPVMVTMALYYGVGLWNNYMSAIIYITKHSLRPLQVMIREILSLTQEQLVDAEQVVPSITMQMAAVVFGSAPVIIIYPFLQRFFVKGVMVGSLKG